MPQSATQSQDVQHSTSILNEIQHSIQVCLVQQSVSLENDLFLTFAGTGCGNPPSTTNIKCVFWGGPVTQDNAKNAGQWRTNFQVVIAGSNGYIAKSIAPINGYTGPTYLGNAAINAPLDCAGGDTFLGSQMFTSGPFDASLCATACQAQSAYNIAHPPSNGAPQTCQFFNTYLLLKNGVSTGQVCALYSMAWDASKYGTNTGQYRGSDRYTIAYSYTFVDSTNPGKPMLPCDVASATSIIKTSSLQPFCSSLLGFTTPLTTVTIPTIVTVPSATVTETVTPVVTTTATTTSLVAVSQFAKRDVPTPTPCSHDHSVKRRDETCDSDIVKRGVLRRDTVTGSPATGTPPLSVAPSTIDTSAYVTLSALATGASGGYIEQPKFGILRRAVPSTPAALATLAPSAVTSGCALQATPVTLTSTISVATSITLSSGTITTQTTLPTTTSTTTQTVVSTTTIVIAQSAPTGAIGYLEVRPAVNGNSKYVLSDPSQHMTDNYYRSATERETFIVAADGSLYSVTHNAYYYVPSTSGPNLLYWSGNPTDASKIFSVGPAGADGSYKLKMAGFGNTYKLCLSKASSSDGNSFTGLHFYYFRTSDTFYSYCLPVDLYIVPV